MLKVIIFDFDGVILESLDIKTKAFLKVYQKEGQVALSSKTQLLDTFEPQLAFIAEEPTIKLGSIPSELPT